MAKSSKKPSRRRNTPRMKTPKKSSTPRAEKAVPPAPAVEESAFGLPDTGENEPAIDPPVVEEGAHSDVDSLLARNEDGLDGADDEASKEEVLVETVYDGDNDEDEWVSVGTSDSHSKDQDESKSQMLARVLTFLDGRHATSLVLLGEECCRNRFHRRVKGEETVMACGLKGGACP